MALKDTVNSMQTLLEKISKDLQKSLKGNKSASQRVRTGTINLSKIGKIYRKESIRQEKKSIKK